MAKADLTAQRLRELFHYAPETGLVTKLKPSRSRDIFVPTLGTLIWTGKSKRPVYTIGLAGRTRLVHRLAWLHMMGEWPIDEIDHIDGDSLNNRWANLRAVSRQDNCRNMPMPKTNTSGAVGVTWRPSKGTWQASITIAGKFMHLGHFSIKEEAVEARKQAEKHYGFHPNHGRTSLGPSLQERDASGVLASAPPQGIQQRL